MIFRRTIYGLSNEHLFYSVDAIVFVEGGTQNYSLQEIINGAYQSESIDVLFWRKIFSLFLPDRKLQYRAIGGKDTLRSIAGQIKNENLNHVYVAMDRDHDNHLGYLIIAPGVFYTYGYSWENDVLNQYIIENIFDTLSYGELQINDELNQVISDFQNDIRWAVYADVLLMNFGDSILYSEGLGRIIHIDKCCPHVNKIEVRNIIHSKRIIRTVKYFFGCRVTIDPLNDCRGKIISFFMFHLVVYLLKKYTKMPSLPKVYFFALAIDKFESELEQEPLAQYKHHYANQFSYINS